MAPTQEQSPSPPLDEILRSSAKLSRTDLQYLQEWLSKQPHLPKLTESELVPFLHSNYYSLEKTKTHIDKYFTMRTHAPELFKHFDVDSEIKTTLGLMFGGLLPKRDQRGRRIVACMLKNRDPTHYDYDVITSAFYNYLDILTHQDPTAEGYVFLMSATNSTFGHLAKINISSISKSSIYFQEAMPVRMLAVHVLNVNAVSEAAYALSKPFLAAEMHKLVHFHSGKMEKFYEEFPRDILPLEFGGSLGSLEEFTQNMHKTLRENMPWLKELANKAVDDSKRPGQAVRVGDAFGMEGSFKKLDID